MKDYEIIKNCLLCNGLLDLVLSLGNSPLANEFLKEPDPYQDKFPLNLMQCQNCGHCQLDCLVNEERMFRHYHYTSSTSSFNQLHFEKYANDVMKDFFPHINENLSSIKHQVGYEDLLIDIGSNDGLFLSYFNNKIRRIGIDPAKNVAKQATEKGIYTIPEFFNEQTAKQEILDCLKQCQSPPYKAKVITANNIFAHNKDLKTIVNGVKFLLDDEGTFIIENSYLLDMVKNGIFDVIYAEHIHHHNITSLDQFFHTLGMRIYDVKHQPNHGGSFRAYICKINAKHLTNKSVEKFKRSELNLKNDLQNFKDKILTLKDKLHKLLTLIVSENKKIGIYGWSAKGTTLMYGLDIPHNMISLVVDDGELKQDKFSPGYNFLVEEPAKIYTSNIDYLLILSWNFAENIINTHKEFKGKWIVPLPELKVV